MSFWVGKWRLANPAPPEPPRARPSLRGQRSRKPRRCALVSVPEQRLLDGVAPSALEQRLIDAVGPSNFNIYEGHLTKPQMASAMGRNTRTLDNWHRNHVGPPRIKFGGVILYNIEAAKLWLAAQSLQ